MDTATPAPIPPQDDGGHDQYWHVWRSHGDRGQPGAWYATKKAGAPEEWAPTIAADTTAELARLMADPPRRVRTGLSDLVAPR